MKLAEALLLRSEYQEKTDSLKKRIFSNLKIQEGDNPHEKPEELLKQLFEIEEKMCELVIQINKRNSEVTIDNGQTLSEALAKRELVMKKRSVLVNIINKADERDFRLSHAEIKMIVSMDISDIQKRIDDLSKEYRLLDTKIQSMNWLTDFN